jgi:predicted phage tail component-like protein
LQTLSFNNVTKPWIYLLEGRQKAPFAPRTNSLLYVAGMPGAYIESSETGVLYITQPVGFVVEDDVDALNKVDELASWLLTSEPVPLTFSDEPNRTYYAKIDGTIEEFRKFVNQRRGTITFICPDPYKYGPELEATFPSDVTNVTVNGTAPTKPVFELEVLAPITFAMIQNQLGEYMMIGRTVNVEDSEPFSKYELVFNANGSNLTGWTTGTTVDGGVVDGTMGTTGTRFEASSYGAGTRWHGPAIKHSLPEVLTDFRMNAFVSLFNAQPDRVGRVEIYLLDANNYEVGKIAMKDIESFQALAWGSARAGEAGSGQSLIDEYGDTPGNWNDFSGIMRLEREGNIWRAYFAIVDAATGKHHTRRSVEWIDTENKYNRTVAQVQIHMAQFGSKPTVVGGVNYINIFKINPPSEGVPYIADVGDIITFDHKDKLILINGEPRKDLKQFGATYFDLQPDDNQLVTMPSDSFNVKATYREAYK